MGYLFGILVGTCVNGLICGAIGAGIAYFAKKKIAAGFKIGFIIGAIWGILSGLGIL